MKIKFKKHTSNFYPDLEKKVFQRLRKSTLEKAKRNIQYKFLFYFIIYLFFCFSLFTTSINSNFYLLIGAYSALGLTGLLLGFNASHDAVHNTLFESKKLNQIAYKLIFALQGVSGDLWKKRHNHSHHMFPNVDGCDADIDNNPFIRLSKTQKLKRIHKFQHYYAPIIYCFYNLHWILIKDFIYLSKKEVANMKNLSYSNTFITKVILLKLFYFYFILYLPYSYSNLQFTQFLIAFLIMHFSISIFFVFTLIISHLTTETKFPIPDEKGYLPTCYYEHQLAVSMDYHPKSKFANFIFGGFNSHAAHHLFHKLPHTTYPIITEIIQQKAMEYKMPYNKLSIGKAIVSHMKYLKSLSKN